MEDTGYKLRSRTEPGIVLDNANKSLQKLLTASKQRTKELRDRYYGFQGDQTQLTPPDSTEILKPKSNLYEPKSDLAKNLFQTPTPPGYNTILNVPAYTPVTSIIVSGSSPPAITTASLPLTPLLTVPATPKVITVPSTPGTTQSLFTSVVTGLTTKPISSVVNSNTSSTKTKMATGINNTSVKSEDSSTPNTQRTQTDLGKRFHHVIKLENFNGDIDTSFTYWLSKFEQFCDLNNITENESAKVLPFYLQSSALVYFNELPQHIKADAKLLKNALRERFEADRRYIDFSILSAKQEKGASVEHYLSKLFKLASDKSIPERLLLSIAIQGFLPNIRKSVLLSQPKQLSELSKLAQLVEKSELGLANSVESTFEVLIMKVRT